MQRMEGLISFENTLKKGVYEVPKYFRGVVCNLGPYPVHLEAQYAGKHFHIRYHPDVAFTSFGIL